MTKTTINLVLLIVFTLVLVGCLSSGSETVTSSVSNNVAPNDTDSTFEQLFANNVGNAPSEILEGTPINHAPANTPLPARVDWSAYATPVRNQGVYQTCTAFASIAAIEIQENIDNKTKNATLDYSELDLFYRSKGKTETYWKTGGNIAWCLESAKAFNGYCREKDSPYTQIPSVPTYTTKIPLCHKIKTSVNFTGAANMKYYLQNGPIVAALTMYYDIGRFRGTGVYTVTTAYSSGGHAVCIVGYDDAEKCWIIKNSWGTGWGNNGYGKIGYGQAKIEQYQAYSVTTK